jgi:hypothetical protein
VAGLRHAPDMCPWDSSTVINTLPKGFYRSESLTIKKQNYDSPIRKIHRGSSDEHQKEAELEYLNANVQICIISMSVVKNLNISVPTEHNGLGEVMEMCRCGKN